MLLLNVGSAVGFKLDSLLKLSETRASTGRMTLMHYLCKVKRMDFLNCIPNFEYKKISNLKAFDPLSLIIFLLYLYVLQVLAEKSPSLLDFHLDLGSLEVASKVMYLVIC